MFLSQFFFFFLRHLPPPTNSHLLPNHDSQHLLPYAVGDEWIDLLLLFSNFITTKLEWKEGNVLCSPSFASNEQALSFTLLYHLPLHPDRCCYRFSGQFYYVVSVSYPLTRRRKKFCGLKCVSPAQNEHPVCLQMLHSRSLAGWPTTSVYPQWTC